jgi:beta-glucuronidase
MLKYVFLLVLCVSFKSLTGQESLLINAYHRPGLSLNGHWRFIIDPYETGFYNYRYQAYDELPNPGRGAFFNDYKAKDSTELVEYSFDRAEIIQVPGDWNTQYEKLFYYEGSIWYRKMFDYTKRRADHRVFVYFGAVNYQADVYLNGKKLGFHKGGFTPFNFEVTGLLREKDNFLVLKVDNKRRKEEVPTLNTDWWNYGGITREVKLVEVAPTFVRDYFVHLNPKNENQLKGYVQLDGAARAKRKVQLLIPGLQIRHEVTTDTSGYAPLEIPVKNLRRWSPDDPYLYTLTFQTDEDTLSDQVGFRTIATKGTDILLNGKPIFLRGICIHEENPMRGGRAYSPEDARLLLGWAKELGCNFVRLAHYPHNEPMIRTADEMGILVWEEDPVYWTIEWENPATYQNAAQQLREVISRDRNRAAVIIWSMANETPVSTPRLAFLQNLAKLARSLDSTRLISAALEQHSKDNDPLTRTIDDPFAADVDVLSFNQYVGWYDGLPDKAASINWRITQNKPVIVSEFGGDAAQGLHGTRTTRWTEEYQEYLYEESLKMLQQIPQLRGMTPWLLADFRSPRRFLPGIQDGWNRKGLLAPNGERKKAFYILQKYYRQKAK